MKYPFKFLESYTQNDKDIFFGREEEVQTLYEMVFQSDLLLVYGASGTGKSSLIQCGLAGRFQSHDWLPIPVRRGENLNLSLEKALIQAGGEISTADASDWNWLEQDWEEDEDSKPQASTKTLSVTEKRFKAIYLQHFKPVYLIFDQFEELYILGNKKEQLLFVETVKEILKVEQPIKIIISIREEYLGELYEFEKAVPELLRKKLRIEPMNLNKVKTVIKGVGALAYSNVFLQKGEEEAIAEGVFTKIKGKEKSLGIQLPYLQVFLDKLYMQLTQDETRQKEATFSLSALAQMGEMGDILRNFLDEQVKIIADNYQQTTDTIWKILSPFVTLEGTKEPTTAAKLTQSLPKLEKTLLQSVLQAFVKSRIIKFREIDEVYEITHDSLAKQIHAKRSEEEIAILEVQRLIKTQVALTEDAREFFSEKQLLFIEPYLTKFALEENEKEWIAKSRAHLKEQKEAEAKKQAEELAKARKRAQTLGGLLFAAVLALFAAGYFYIDAKNNAERAEAQTKMANEQTEIAKTNAIKARDAQISDSIARVKADSLAKVASTEKNNALTSAKAAEEQKRVAEQNLSKFHQAEYESMLKKIAAYRSIGKEDAAIQQEAKVKEYYLQNQKYIKK